MIQQTSLISFSRLDHLNEKYQQIMQLLTIYPDSTDYELSIFSGHSNPNYIRPRRNELMKYGFIVSTGKRVCQITGKLAKTWRLA